MPPIDTPAPAPIYLPIDWGISVVLAAAIGLALTARALIRQYRRQQRDPHWREPDRQSRVLYWQMRRRLARAGIGALPNVTPDEFLSTYAANLRDQPQLHSALQQVTTLYVRAA